MSWTEPENASHDTAEEMSTTDGAGSDCSGRSRPLDWIVTAPFLIAFGLVLVIFDPIQRLARLFGSRPHEFVVGLMQASLLGTLRICGTRFQVERSPEVAPHTPYLIIANHQSMFDIPILGAFLFTNYPKFVSKRELAHWIPSISYNLRRGGHALIDRAKRRQAIEAIRGLGNRAQERGVSAVIYPEGTRARWGEIRPFKTAGALALLKAAPALAVVPVAIDESWRLLRRNLFPVPFGVRVRVYFGAPIRRVGADDGASIVERARAEIEGKLRQWRALQLVG
jgi:1-acyl-sn-glycerol-3-phosphate acyltransferase